MSKEQKTLAREWAKKAAEELWSAFEWAGTKEGYTFWLGVLDRLEEYARTGKVGTE